MQMRLDIVSYIDKDFGEVLLRGTYSVAVSVLRVNYSRKNSVSVGPGVSLEPIGQIVLFHVCLWLVTAISYVTKEIMIHHFI